MALMGCDPLCPGYVYALGLSLPDGPLQVFIEATKALPRATEAERLAVRFRQRSHHGSDRARLT